MLGYVATRAARGQWRMYQKSRNQPGPKNNALAWVYAADVMAVLGVPCTLAAHQWAWAGICAVASVLLTLMLVAAHRQRSAPSKVTEHYAAQFDQRQRRQSPAALRAMAAAMKEDV